MLAQSAFERTQRFEDLQRVPFLKADLHGTIFVTIVIKIRDDFPHEIHDDFASDLH